MTSVVTREMGLTHAEFFRTLARAFAGWRFEIQGTTVTIFEQERLLEITLAPEQERRIALLRLPVTQVKFTFHDYSDGQRSAFLRHFDRYFQRGGG
ncbi:MAG: hypothetical protein V2J55_18660 [Candidatus Competibacteraceae bacterium]|jgi:hypothetical protein|nr:hypothetical protein [Candidatus Competibacteraceae bacterium]